MVVRNPDQVFVTPQQLPAACQGPLHPAAEEGIALFDAGKYWEAHEALETAWRQEPGPARHLYQGILQVGVVYLQIERNNFIGMAKMFERCQKWLAPWPKVCRGIHVDQLRADVAAAVAAAGQLGPGNLAQFDRNLFRKIERVA